MSKDADMKVWVPDHLKLALHELAELDERKLSDYVCHVLMNHVYGQQRKLCDPSNEGAHRDGASRRGPG